MAQRNVEMLIGRLIADEEFRNEFIANPEPTLRELCTRGFELSATEIAALVNTDPALWLNAAERLDARVQKASLRNEPGSQKEKEHHA